ncbi:mitochondrial import inner membrane translocase subunit TIM44-2-like isoform X3 [Rhodamnia argentea]|uniref:Mitochondrial import inner membrane translocase subunit TIM44-2-like isoform X3 n=1 Tax=Rhodamnia argentea TaxID=178133 RepID=A0ABM3HIY4_9MYRT|nr:mitochondrial import inner membrane translocase subunit TIM44-2-like isoform X3 [Rhodamnia argentea]
MAGKKLVRDLVLLGHPLRLHLSSQPQASSSRLRLITAGGHPCNRRYSVFNEFSKKVKGEASSNPEFQKSVKQLKEKAEELQGVKEELKVRTKQTTEQLYKHVDGVWTEAEATAKKVKEQFGIGKQEESASANGSTKHDAHTKGGNDGKSTEEKCKQAGSGDNTESFFGKYRTNFFSSSPKVSSTFQKLKEVKVVDLAKKGYDIVKDELSGSPSKRKHMDHAPTTSTVERSTRTDIVVLPSKQSPWSKKWEAFKGKVKGHPMFKRIGNVSDPVVTKGHEFAEDIKERWETSDNPVVHKIQDINETLFQETDAAASIKEIRRRDPSFSLPEFVAEVQEVVKPVLNAYIKGDVEILKKYCSSEIIERCKAEHGAYKNHGIFFDNKILHVSDVDVRETKMMGTSPIIIVGFQTQQIYCVRDRNGAITEGGADTIHTVYYAWAMQQVDPEELGEGAIYPIWRLREMQQIGVQALI